MYQRCSWWSGAGGTLPTKGAACRNMPFSTTYGKTVANWTVLNLVVGFMLKVGGVLDGPEQKSQESRLRDEKVLHARGTCQGDVTALTRLFIELTVSAA